MAWSSPPIPSSAEPVVESVSVHNLAPPVMSVPSPQASSSTSTGKDANRHDPFGPENAQASEEAALVEQTRIALHAGDTDTALRSIDPTLVCGDHLRW
jgi:hypothetical protein